MLRKQREQVAQQRYARALANCRKAGQVMQSATAEWEAALVELKREMGAGISGGQFANMRNGCLVLEIRWREHQAAWIEACRVAALIFQEMAAATREREGLDQFHHRARREHELQLRRAEQKNFDEMATQSTGSGRRLQFGVQTLPDTQ